MSLKYLLPLVGKWSARSHYLVHRAATPSISLLSRNLLARRAFGTQAPTDHQNDENRSSNRAFGTIALDNHHRPSEDQHPSIQGEYHPPIPDYLNNVYWWAYVSKTSISILDNQFLVNLVLWGNANTLRDAALNEVNDVGRTLQVACVYGNFTQGLVSKLKHSSLNIIDVVPDQLYNLKRKMNRDANKASNVKLSCYDAQQLGFLDETFDQAVFYMLLHEMPTSVRRNAIQQAFRVLKPGGTLVFIDFHRPECLWRRVLISIWFLLEPFAKDLWTTDIQEWFPEDMTKTQVHKETYAGGLFQKIVVTKPQ